MQVASASSVEEHGGDAVRAMGEESPDALSATQRRADAAGAGGKPGPPPCLEDPCSVLGYQGAGCSLQDSSGPSLQVRVHLCPGRTGDLCASNAAKRKR